MLLTDALKVLSLAYDTVNRISSKESFYNREPREICGWLEEHMNVYEYFTTMDSKEESLNRLIY